MSALTYSAHRAAIAQGRFVRVVNYHNTPRATARALRAELERYAASYTSLTLADLDGFYATGAWPGERPGFIPVFYEGYRNSYDVAMRVCDDLGITGWFPIATAFVDCPVAEQEAFARSHWIELVDAELDGDRIAMSWEEVADLSTRHVVTPHTGAHEAIPEVITDSDLEREVTEPKRRLDAVTGQCAPAFVWLAGTPWGASPRHDEAVRAAGYRYLISNTMIHRIA